MRDLNGPLYLLKIIDMKWQSYNMDLAPYVKTIVRKYCFVSSYIGPHKSNM